MKLEFEKILSTRKTEQIPGMIEFNLPVHGDNRGWFKENFQFEKFREIGFPADFLRENKLQNNISFNEKVGVTRGLHAEPWDKFISIANGKVFGAWCDLRKGENFGKTYTTILDPTKAIFVPRGVANGFQTLEPNTVYTYLVNDYWSPDAKYAFVNLADPEIGIDWPIDLSGVELSDKDRKHPFLRDVRPMYRSDLFKESDETEESEEE